MNRIEELIRTREREFTAGEMAPPRVIDRRFQYRTESASSLADQKSLFVLGLELEFVEFDGGALDECRNRDTLDGEGGGADRGSLMREAMAVVRQRLKRCLRQTDIVCRLSADQYVVIPALGHNSRQAAALATRVLEAGGRTGDLTNARVFWRPSLGIARFPSDAEDVNGMLAAANDACRRAQALGGSQFCFYAEELNFRTAATLVS